MDVLEDCVAPGNYKYIAFTPKLDQVTINDEDDLYATMPLGAAKLSAKLQQAKQLSVAMTLVGKYEAVRRSVKKEELRGRCEDATHVVVGLTTGAFEFFAGASAGVAGGAEAFGVGAGGQSSAKRELLRRDGDPAACNAAGDSDTAPPRNCGALIKLDVVQLGAGGPSIEAAQPPVALAPATTLDQLLDMRESLLNPRPATEITAEIEDLKRALAATAEDRRFSPTLRIGDDYAELARTLHRTGNAAGASGAHDDAIRYYGIALPISGNVRIEVQYRLARERDLAAVGKSADANRQVIEDYRAVSGSPADTAYHAQLIDNATFALGDLYARTGQLEFAVDAYAKVRRDSALFPHMLVHLAKAYEKSGDMLRAERAYGMALTALKTAPQNRETSELLDAIPAWAKK
jgi:hypothetical protein